MISFVLAHWLVLLQLFAVASVVAAALDQIATAIAPTWPKAAHYVAAVAHVLPQVLLAGARILTALTGRPFVVLGATPQASAQTSSAPTSSQR